MRRLSQHTTQVTSRMQRCVTSSGARIPMLSGTESSKNKPKPNAYGEMKIGEGVGNICNQSGGTPHILYPPKAETKQQTKNIEV